MSDRPSSRDAELLAQRRGLEQLALRMRTRREDADDLVQDVMLVALRRPRGEERDHVHWLRGVLRRLWLKRRQRSARDRARPLDPQLPAEVPPASAAVERSELAKRLAQLVLELDEPYRTVLLQRYYEDRTPSEIAVVLGRPVNTVTSQLGRGLEQLRGRLGSRETERERNSWWFFGWFRRRPATSAPRRVLARWALAAVMVGLSVVVWLTVRPREAAGPARPAPPIARTDQGASVTEPANVDPLPERMQVAGETAGPAGEWLDVEVVDAADEPLPGVSISIVRVEDDAATAWEDVRIDPAGETDARGRLRVSLHASARPYGWQCDLAGSDLSSTGLVLKKEGVIDTAYQLLFAPREGAIRIRVPERSVTVRGTVLDADGRPVRAMVSFDSACDPERQANGALLQEVTRVVASDASGRYEIPLIEPGLRVVHAGMPPYPVQQEWIDGAPGAVLVRDFVLQHGTTVAVTVLDENDAPVADVDVLVAEWRYDEEFIASPGITGPDGRCVLDDACSGGVIVTAEHPEDESLFDVAFLGPSLVPRECVLVLRRHPPARFRVRSSAGVPLSDCVVRIRCPDPNDAWNASVVADGAGLATLTRVAEGQRFDLEIYRSIEELVSGAPPCATVVDLVSGAAEQEVVVAAGRLARGVVTGRVAFPPDEARPRTRLCLRAPGSRRFHATRVAEHDGAFRRELSAQRYAATLVLDGRGSLPLGELEIVAGQTLDLEEIRLPAPARVEIDWRWTQTVTRFELVALETVDAAGAPEKEWLVVCGSTAAPADLSLLPGRYRWTVTRADRTLERRDLELEPGGFLVLRTGPQGALEER